jgi:thioesterase domain-containing protein
MPNTALPASSPFVRIKAGSERPPIFIAHGVCGTVQFFRLAKHIHTDNPVYGIQARGIDDAEKPFDRVEDMGAFYLDALQQTHGEGPYILVGYSFGGLVALEMAQCLLKAGKEVALLVLVDTYPHPRFLAADQRRRLFLKRLRNHLSQVQRLPLPDALEYVFRGIQKRFKFVSSSESFTGDLEATPRGTALERVKQSAYLAFQRYQPAYYPGKVKLVTAEVKTFFPDDPAAVWGKLVRELEVEVVPGDHLSIVNKDFEPLAAVITRYVRELKTATAYELSR